MSLKYASGATVWCEIFVDDSEDALATVNLEGVPNLGDSISAGDKFYKVEQLHWAVLERGVWSELAIQAITVTETIAR